ncbi:SCO family protein [Flavobacteriaceae bacterium S356]|uniref:SCO family protein n=1 Tax=Asprobacillus argus TaxID=3076534 RepID=A0ABU3LHR9_9FLAO|nr:SCO family protein [Flavobacteriaceae bacterium S356]
MKMSLRNNLFIALILVVSVSCKTESKKTVSSRVASLPFYEDPSFTPKWMDPKGKEVIGFHSIPDFNFVNQEGEKVTSKTFDNKIFIADFFFTACPGICPIMTRNMTTVQEAFKDDSSVSILSHSVTPKKDSVAQLKKYALEKGVISGKWHLVTGDRSEIYNLGRNFYFVDDDLGVKKDEDDFLHTENFVLIDKKKHIRGIYNGLSKNSVQQLIADIKTLKKEE